MKIIIASDSFKGSLTAQEAAVAMEQGVRSVWSDAEIDSIPMADGGEGTLEALVASTKGRFIETEAVNPLGRSMNGRYGILGDEQTAVIEMSAVSGLLLLDEKERNPLHTTTYGTGQLIRHALESGYRKYIVGIGGSATNDCGTGMAQALGVRFLDQNKTEIFDKMCGNLLGEVNVINMSSLHPMIQKSRITVACDVKNPLLGKNGSAHVYSKQKGATSEIVQQLEKNMTSFIDIAERTIQKSVRDVPGTGAAGGLGAGLMLFLKAELHPGVDLVMDACHFSERIQGADLILTGEGKIDEQTKFGKTIAGIGKRAKAKNIPVMAFAGIVENAENFHELGITKVISIRPESMLIDRAMGNAKKLLQKAVKKVMREWKDIKNY
jgi:glycerate kinase